MKRNMNTHPHSQNSQRKKKSVENVFLLDVNKSRKDADKYFLCNSQNYQMKCTWNYDILPQRALKITKDLVDQLSYEDLKLRKQLNIDIKIWWKTECKFLKG